MTGVRVFRWKAIVPMLLTALLVAVVWRLFLNPAIRRGTEIVGAEVVGAKVDLEAARLRLRDGDLVLRGLEVANPDAPMTNLFEAQEIVADLNGEALLMGKVVVDSLIVRRVRFGTPRRTSGALDQPSPTTGLVTRRVLAWADALPTPTLDLTGIIGTVVDVPAISPDSLRTPRQAARVGAGADSLRAAWTSELRAIEPQPVIDSARALAERLRGADTRRLGPTGVAAAANDVRTLSRQLDQTRDRLAQLERGVAQGVASTQAAVLALDSARRADYAYARGLVNIPSFAAPDVSAALFGRMVRARLQPILQWINLAEEYVPPGLRPRRDPGARRARMDGTTYRFPVEESWPAFLVRRAEADLAIGGDNVTAGAYRASITGLTTAPAAYGRPMTLRAGRISDVGPRELVVAALMDRTGATPRDSVSARVGGVALPDVTLEAAQGAKLAFGASTVELALTRTGGTLEGTWRVRAPAVTWTRSADSATGPAPRPGSEAWAEALVWRAISAVRDVTIEARLSGAVTGPAVSISTNVGTAVADAVQREIGAEIERTERVVRAEVDRRIAASTAEARRKAAALESDVQRRVGESRQRLEAAKTELELRLRELQGRLPGIRLPGGIPRPGGS